MDCCPLVPKCSDADIFIYLVEIRSQNNLTEVLGAYKGLSAESKQAVKDGWVCEVMVMVLPSGFVLIKAKVSLKFLNMRIYSFVCCNLGVAFGKICVRY